MSATLRESAFAQLPFTLSELDVAGLGEKIRGKVRDSYVRGDTRILITSDRLSAFDVILTTIPFKGELLNGIAGFWFDVTSDIVTNHLIDRPHPNVLVTREVKIIPVEVIVRGYLAGWATRDYKAGRPVSGVQLPPGLKEFQRFERPILTPSTKAPSGTHDEPISSEEVVRSGIVPKQIWQEVEEKALALFKRGTEKAAERGLILVDTKYEFGLGKNNELILADEIHTQDSSRYWVRDTYESRFREGKEPEMLDKEFVRRWLIERGYMGNGPIPAIPDEFRVDVALRYIDTFQRITGKTFTPAVGSPAEGILRAVKQYCQ